MRLVAACFSGRLNISIPEHGGSARKALVEVLDADVFVAGTYQPSDCDGRGGDCLLSMVRGLQPIIQLTMAPMQTWDELNATLQQAPAFDELERAFTMSKERYLGLSVFSPVLGTRRASVLRQLYDLSRVFGLVEAEERRRGRRYERLVFTRLEYHWLVEHPPLAILDDRLLWVPYAPGGEPVTDQHAVMPRRLARIYFQRWELLHSGELLRVLRVEKLVRDGPEAMLASLLKARGVAVGHFPQVMCMYIHIYMYINTHTCIYICMHICMHIHFPQVMYLACCTTSDRQVRAARGGRRDQHTCWSTACSERHIDTVDAHGRPCSMSNSATSSMRSSSHPQHRVAHRQPLGHATGHATEHATEHATGDSLDRSLEGRLPRAEGSGQGAWMATPAPSCKVARGRYGSQVGAATLLRQLASCNVTLHAREVTLMAMREVDENVVMRLQLGLPQLFPVSRAASTSAAQASLAGAGGVTHRAQSDLRAEDVTSQLEPYRRRQMVGLRPIHPSTAEPRSELPLSNAQSERRSPHRLAARTRLAPLVAAYPPAPRRWDHCQLGAPALSPLRMPLRPQRQESDGGSPPTDTAKLHVELNARIAPPISKSVRGTAAASEEDAATAGRAVHRFSDGEWYEGGWDEAGRMDGHGTFHLANGNVYNGSFKDGQPDGRGAVVCADGTVFKGEWRAGYVEGHGSVQYVGGHHSSSLYRAGKFGTPVFTGGILQRGRLWSADQLTVWGMSENGPSAKPISP